MKAIRPTWRQVARLTTVMAVVLLAACSDAGIKTAKQEPYPRHSGTTFSNVLDNYQWCKSKKWESKELKTGEKYVQFTCMATAPDVKTKISEYVAELDAKDAQELAKINGSDEEFMKRTREYAYSKQIGAIQNVELDEERLQNFNMGTPSFVDMGGRRETILYELGLSRDRLKAFQTPEYVASAEALIQEEKAKRDEVIAERNKRWEEGLVQRRQAVVDGTIQVVFQWQLTQSGGVGNYSMAVNFDFGGRPYTVDGEDGVANSMLAAVYQDQPITNGLREVLNRDAIFNAPDGAILYHLSRKSMKAKSRS